MSAMQEPQLSVIVPVYNGERFLAEALSSVCSQSVIPMEIVVVDDGSTDGTAKIARDFNRVRYVPQENRGPAAARNKGVLNARGDLLAFLDHDDLWSPVKLGLQLRLLRENPELEMVSGHVQCLRLSDSGKWERHGSPRLMPLFGAILARRSAFERVGPLDETLRCTEDLDWFIRAREAGVRTAAVKETVLYYRLHGENTTRGCSTGQAGYVRAVKKLLDRRRGLSR